MGSKVKTSCPHHQGPAGDQDGLRSLGATKETIISTHQSQQLHQPGHAATREDLAARQAPMADPALPAKDRRLLTKTRNHLRAVADYRTKKLRAPAT